MTTRISIEEYFRKPHSDEQFGDALELLRRVNDLLAEFANVTGREPQIDPDTDSGISGSKGGDGDGGFRTPGSQTGSPRSSHREARAVDVYDPENHLDTWLDGFEGAGGENAKLAQHDLYREHPSATPGWCHLSTRAPGSGRRTFYP